MWHLCLTIFMEVWFSDCSCKDVQCWSHTKSRSRKEAGIVCAGCNYQPVTWHLPLYMLSSSTSWSHRMCKFVSVNLSVVNLSVLLLQFLLACGAATWEWGRQWHYMDPLVGDGYLHRGNQVLILCKRPLQLFMLKLNMPVYVCPRKCSLCVYDVSVWVGHERNFGVWYYFNENFWHMNYIEYKSVDEQHSGTKLAKLLNPQGMLFKDIPSK